MNILKNHWTVHLKYSLYTKNHWIVYLKIQFIYTLNCTACVLYLNKDAKEENMEDGKFPWYLEIWKTKYFTAS